MNKDIDNLSIPLTEGIAWTTNWRDADHHLKAASFLFNADDFRDILQEETVRYVRLYVALKVTENNTIEEKMICVGVDSHFKDILAVAKTGGDSGVYDFSNPCPPLCQDNESPLAGG